jgi:hypothetical protein
MEKKFSRKWGSRNVTIKVTHGSGGRVDIHRNISKDEISWITANPNLEVEVIEMKFFKNRGKNKDGNE